MCSGHCPLGDLMDDFAARLNLQGSAPQIDVKPILSSCVFAAQGRPAGTALRLLPFGDSHCPGSDCRVCRVLTQHLRSDSKGTKQGIEGEQILRYQAYKQPMMQDRPCGAYDLTGNCK